jgi:hypothetical protein
MASQSAVEAPYKPIPEGLHRNQLSAFRINSWFGGDQPGAQNDLVLPASEPMVEDVMTVLIRRADQGWCSSRTPS